MKPELQEKILNGLIRAVATLLAGSGVWQISGGELFGQLVFTGFSNSLSLTLLNQHLIAVELYQLWSRQIVFGSLSEAMGLKAVLLLLLLLVLIAHVVFKYTLPEAQRSIGRYPSFARFYLRFYFHLTVAFLVLTLSAMFLVQRRFWLVATFALWGKNYSRPSSSDRRARRSGRCSIVTGSREPSRFSATSWF